MDDTNNNKISSPRRNKLGLALAGGGFRASLFHLGVLHRMAELDLLRSVEVLSTVSGGSIIGALYILLLKKEFKKSGGKLTRDQYKKIINDLDEILVAGVKKNLRTRLFMNPFGLFRVLISSYSLGKRMSRIYERYIYKKVVDELQPSSWWAKLWRPGKILLKDILLNPGQGAVPGGIESYNRSAINSGGSVITNLILNATSLNSGVSFRFSCVEIGDNRLGFLRYDEISQLMDRKKLIFDINLIELKNSIANNTTGTLTIRGIQYDYKTVSLIYWWRLGKENPNQTIPIPPAGWSPLFPKPGFPACILNTEFGLLRELKLAAWYFRKGPDMKPQPVTGGLTPNEHLELFWEGLKKIDENQAVNLKTYFKNNRLLLNLFLDFVLEFYYLRSAEIMSPKIKNHWGKLTLGEAVGASACFPPVFPPYITHDFYDDWHVSRLGLTDGGVYDNLGLTTLFEERCSYIIVSDTGGIFFEKQQSSQGRLGMIGRIVSILQDDIGKTQREVLRGKRNTTKRIENLINMYRLPANSLTNHDLLGLAFFHINSPTIGIPRLNLNLDGNILASIRTDLDGFGDVEIAALVNHGYDTADQYLRRYLTNSPYMNQKYLNEQPQEPKPIKPNENDVKKILLIGKSRFFRALQVHAPVSILFTIAAIIGIIIVTWKTKVSMHDIINYLEILSLGWIESIFSFLGSGWTEHRFSIGVFLLIVGIAATLIVILKVKIITFFKRLQNGYLPWLRRFFTIYKWTRSLFQNIVWFSGLWPLILILACSVFACISHIFYYLPYEIKTRNIKR